MTSRPADSAIPEALSRTDNLPSMPAVAVEVLRLTRDENSTIDDLTAAISRDPALSAKLLKLSNSSLFGMGQRVTTLQRATMILGMKTVKLMSLSFSLVNTFPKSDTTTTFDFKEFWRRSLVFAVAARSLASLTGRRLADEAFLCGLLSGLGQIVILQCLPEQYETVLKRAGRTHPSPALEREILGYDSASVAAALLKQWELPPMLYLSIGCLAQPEKLPANADTDTRELLRLLGCAQLAVAILCDEDKGRPLEHLYAAAKQDFSIGTDDVNFYLHGLESGVREAADLLEIKLARELPYQEIIEQARLQLVSISLGTALDLQQARRRADEIENEKKELESIATTDKLTGVPNRACFDSTLDREVADRPSYPPGTTLGLILLDVDHFKKFNDAYGHPAGDEVLRAVGKILRDHVPSQATPARYGGEEFAVIVRQTTRFALSQLAEKLRAAVASARVEIPSGKSVSVTASFGAACLPHPAPTRPAAELVKIADTQLYQAKREGRDRCSVAP